MRYIIILLICLSCYNSTPIIHIYGDSRAAGSNWLGVNAEVENYGVPGIPVNATEIIMSGIKDYRDINIIFLGINDLYLITMEQFINAVQKIRKNYNVIFWDISTIKDDYNIFREYMRTIPEYHEVNYTESDFIDGVHFSGQGYRKTESEINNILRGVE
jgi:lysophospholipase L1-like esterase